MTARAGLADRAARAGARAAASWTTTATAELDLFVANYLRFDLATAAEPGQGRQLPLEGHPRELRAQGPAHRHEPALPQRRRRHASATCRERSGVATVTGRYAMTAAAADFDGDGWLDIYVACDSTAVDPLSQQPRRDLHGRRGRERRGLRRVGNAQAGMGLAVGDYDRDGRLDLLKTHFADDIPALYRNLGRGQFEDAAIAAGLAVQNRYVEWGAGMPDLDNDGWPDLVYVTGNVYPEIEALLAAVPAPRSARRVPQPRRRALRGRHARAAGRARCTPHSSRGAAFGDFDNDGDVDVLVMNMNEPPSLLRNDYAGGNGWLEVRLEGTRSNRAGLGATVRRRRGGPHAGAGRPQPDELLLARRPAPAFRPRPRRPRRSRRGALAERPWTCCGTSPAGRW